MNTNELAAELARNGLSIPAAANRIGIGKKAFYSKMKGLSQFKQAEICKLREILALTDERTMEIFFADSVS